MSNSYFEFKQFRIGQDRCAMKVTTDACILGAYAPAPDEGTILDIGSGTGLLALMLAQRTQAIIDAVELDASAFCNWRKILKRVNGSTAFKLSMLTSKITSLKRNTTSLSAILRSSANNFNRQQPKKIGHDMMFHSMPMYCFIRCSGFWRRRVNSLCSSPTIG